jgi:HEAT repeat protein
VTRLEASGDEAVKRLRPLLVPQAVPNQPPVEKLLAQLDDDDFETRERATRMLMERGEAVVPKLQTALKASPSAEVRIRIGRILKQFPAEGSRPSAVQLRALRAITALGRIDTPASRALLAEIVKGPEGRPQTVAAKALLGREPKGRDKGSMGLGN